MDYIPSKKTMNRRKEDNRSWFKQMGLLSAGLAFPVSIVIGYGMGYFLDQWLGTTFLKIVFLLFGVAAGFVSFYRTITQIEKDQ